MERQIHLGRIGLALVIAIIVAVAFFQAGKKFIASEGYNSFGHDTLQSFAPKEERKTEPNTYKNDTYGFGAIFLAKAETATECPLDSRMANNPIKEYIFGDGPVECAHDTQDPQGFYKEHGGQLGTWVFDLSKCRDKVSDKAEKDFCAIYAKTSATDGRADNGWPSGRWTKSGDFLTFYTDLSFGENPHYTSDYKFLVLER
jgi:hypothetical protein